MTKPLFFPSKATAEIVRAKLQAQHKDRSYMIATRPGGFEIIFGYTGTPTGPFSNPEDIDNTMQVGEAANVALGLTPSEPVAVKVIDSLPDLYEAALGLNTATPVGVDLASGPDTTAIVAMDFAQAETKIVGHMLADPLKAGDYIEKAAIKTLAYGSSGPVKLKDLPMPEPKKKPATQAPKPGTATGDDALAPAQVDIVGDSVVMTLPFRGESPAYVDAFFNGKPISIGRPKIEGYEVLGTRVLLTVSKKFAKSRGFID